MRRRRRPLPLGWCFPKKIFDTRPTPKFGLTRWNVKTCSRFERKTRWLSGGRLSRMRHSGLRPLKHEEGDVGAPDACAAVAAPCLLAGVLPKKYLTHDPPQNSG